MAFNLGVNVVEVDGRAAPTIVAAPISVAGFLVRSVRGIPNQAVPISGFGDFTANFGSYSDTAFGAHAVRGFFENGGSEAFAVRIVRNDNSAVAANATLTDRAAAPVGTLRIAAGMRGQEDPGGWGNALSVAVEDHPRGNSFLPAQILGSAAEPFALVNGQTLIVAIEGGTTETITFSTADFTNIGAAGAAEVAAAVNRRTARFRLGVTPAQQLVMARVDSRTDSRLAVSGTAAATLGFTAATANSDAGLVNNSTTIVLQSVGGVLPNSAISIELRGHLIAAGNVLAAIANGSQIIVTVDGGAAQTITFQASDFVGGVGAITAAELVNAINRQAVGFIAGLNFNGRLILMSNRYGQNSTISLAAGAPDARAALGFSGLEVAVAGNRQFRAVSQVIESSKMILLTTPLAATPTNAARFRTVEFDLIVSRNGTEIERFESVSMQDTLNYYVEALVNDPERGSGFITVQDLNSASGAGLDAPAERRDAVTSRLLFTPLINGNDGNAPIDIDYMGDPALRTGLYAFDTVNIQLLACPEITTNGFVNSALGYCEQRGDAMFVGTTPRELDLEGVKNYAGAFRGRKVYGALYYPWIQIVNPTDTTGANPRMWVPPVGHVLGTYVRIGEARGVWKAPAGDEAFLRGALAVDVEMTETDHTDLVKNGGVNAIRAVPRSGIIIDSSRTLSTDTRWLFINVRRLFNFVKSSLREGLRFVAQEPHTEELRRTVKFSVVKPFLLGLWRQGAFGSDPAEAVFTIICGPENNPPSEVNLGNFRIEVYFYPVKPAETIVLIIGQQDSTASASDS